MLLQIRVHVFSSYPVLLLTDTETGQSRLSHPALPEGTRTVRPACFNIPLPWHVHLRPVFLQPLVSSDIVTLKP